MDENKETKKHVIIGGIGREKLGNTTLTEAIQKVLDMKVNGIRPEPKDEFKGIEIRSDKDEI